MKRFFLLLSILLCLYSAPIYAKTYMLDKSELTDASFSSENISTAKKLRSDIYSCNKPYYIYREKSEKVLNRNISALCTLYTFCDSTFITFSDQKDYYIAKINIAKYKKAEKNAKTYQNEINRIINLTKDLPDKEKIAALNDYIVNNYEYDYTLRNNKSLYEKMDSGILLHILKTHKTICIGFANLNSLFYSYFSIPNDVICTENHALNKVIIDNKTYYVDTTWNLSNKDHTKYLLMTEEEASSIYDFTYIENDRSVKIMQTVKVKYDLNGGRQNSLNKTIYRYDRPEKLYTPTKKGYHFLGWFYQNRQIRSTKNITKNIKLTARWTKCSF